jgi:hypothetical protein
LGWLTEEFGVMHGDRVDDRLDQTS